MTMKQENKGDKERVKKELNWEASSLSLGRKYVLCKGDVQLLPAKWKSSPC